MNISERGIRRLNGGEILYSSRENSMWILGCTKKHSGLQLVPFRLAIECQIAPAAMALAIAPIREPVGLRRRPISLPIVAPMPC